MGLGKRLTSQGITWEQLAFQFIIVLVGVYLAIYLERSAEEAGEQERLKDMLGFLLDEIAQDERDMQAILEGYSERIAALEMASITFTHRSQRDAITLDSLFNENKLGNRTVYLRQAAYKVLSTSGLLAELREVDLGFQLSNLYEHYYPRLKYNGELLDIKTGRFQDELRSHWDPVHRRFLPIRAVDGASMSIAMGEYMNQHEYYRFLLQRTTETIGELRPRIERYVTD